MFESELLKITTVLLNTNYKYIKNIKVHTSESFFFEFIYNNQILVTTVNLKQKTLCMYVRSGKEIPEIKKIFREISFFQKNSNSLYAKFEKNEIFDKILQIAYKLEKYNISKNKINVTEDYNDILGNQIKIEEGCKLEKITVSFKGNNNFLLIKKNSSLQSINIDFNLNKSKVEFGNNPRLKCDIKLGENCKINIGNNITSTGKVYITAAESSNINIKDDCMFATNNQIRTDDAHPIYDCLNGKRVNIPKDIIINEHVWIAYGACLFSGTQIGKGSVVGAFALTKKKFPNNCIIAGIPAKIVKKDIFWDRKSLVSMSTHYDDYPLDLHYPNYINLTKD